MDFVDIWLFKQELSLVNSYIDFFYAYDSMMFIYF